MFMFYSILISLISLLLLATSDDCSLSFDPLSCFLDQAKLPVPSTCAYGPDGIYFCLNNTICSNIHVTDLTSLYVPPMTISVTVTRLSTICEGDWSMTKSSGDLSEGTIGIDLSGAGVNTSLSFKKNQTNYLPSNPVLVCEFLSDDMKVKTNFTGLRPGEDWLVEQLLQDAIFVFLQKGLLCSQLELFISRNFTDLLENELDSRLEAIIRSEKDVPPVMIGQVDWGTSKAIELVHTFIDIINFVHPRV